MDRDDRDRVARCAPLVEQTVEIAECELGEEDGPLDVDRIGAHRSGVAFDGEVRPLQEEEPEPFVFVDGEACEFLVVSERPPGLTRAEPHERAELRACDGSLRRCVHGHVAQVNRAHHSSTRCRTSIGRARECTAMAPTRASWGSRSCSTQPSTWPSTTRRMRASCPVLTAHWSSATASPVPVAFRYASFRVQHRRNASTRSRGSSASERGRLFRSQAPNQPLRGGQGGDARLDVDTDCAHWRDRDDTVVAGPRHGEMEWAAAAVIAHTAFAQRVGGELQRARRRTAIAGNDQAHRGAHADASRVELGPALPQGHAVAVVEERCQRRRIRRASQVRRPDVDSRGSLELWPPTPTHGAPTSRWCPPSDPQAAGLPNAHPEQL